jgi:hypothetical protein
MKLDDIMRKPPLWAALLLSVICATTARSGNSCVPTHLSQKEAQRLVLTIPDAVAARKLGSKLSAVNYDPGPTYSHEQFYYFMLLSSMTKATLLDNGIIGYFSVNKATGRILDVADEEVLDETLAKLQAALWVKHCVSQDLILKNQTIAP